MPVDASIYSQIKPFTMSDPVEQQSKLFSLQHAALGIENQRLQMDQTRAAAAEGADLKAAAVEADGDPAKLASIMLKRGHVKEGVSLRKSLAEEQKAQIETKLKISEGIGADAMSLDAAWNAALQKNNGNEQAALAEVTPVYQQIRAKWKDTAPLPEQFDPVSIRANIGHAKDAARYFNAQLEKFGPSTPGVNPDTGKPELFQTSKTGGAPQWTGIAPVPQGTELSRLIAARDALPQGHPDRVRYDQAINNETVAKRDRGSSTNVTVQAPGPMMPGKPAQGKIDEAVLDGTRHQMVLNQINSQFKPEFQTYFAKGSMEALSVKEKAGFPLTNKQKQDLTEFSQYRRNAIGSLNEYIKSITGAAMSEKEAERIMKAMPNPGMGFFDGDGPTEFKAKLDDAIRQTSMAVARAAYQKRQGLSLSDGAGNPTTPLERMPAIMNQRGKEIEAQLRQMQPKADDKMLQKAVRRQLSVEFGLSND